MRMESKESSVGQLKQWIRDHHKDLSTHHVATIVAEYHGEGDEGCLGSLGVLDQSGGLVPRETAALFFDALWPLFESIHDALAPQGYEINEGGGGEFRADVQTGTLTHTSYDLVTERVDRFEEKY
jgi:hypothetical protein